METTLAYLAGIVDGEGYIGIKRSAKVKGSVSPRFCERIQVRMIHEDAIKLLANTLGGNYYCENMARRGGRQLYCWQASDAQAAGILTVLLPYLRIKKGNAIAALALRQSKADPLARKRGSPAKRVMDPTVIAHRQQLYERCKELNAR